MFFKAIPRLGAPVWSLDAMMRHAPHHDAGDGQGFHVRKRSTLEIVRRVAVYLRPYRGMAAANVGCAILSLGCAFAFPQLLQSIIDDLRTGARTSYLAPAAWLALAFLLRDAFNSLRIRVNNIFEQNVIFDMRREVFARLQRLPVGYFDQRASGDLMTRVIEDVNSVERVLIDGTEQGTVASLSVVGVLVVLFCKNALLAAIALIPIPLLTGGVMRYTLTAHRRYRAQRRASSAMSAYLMDSLQGIRQIKAFGRQDHEDGRFDQHADALRQANLGVMRVWAVYSPAMTFAASLGTALVIWLGGAQVRAGNMTLGQLVAFLFYLALFYDPVSRLHGLNQMLQAARAAGERVFDILDSTEERPAFADGQRQGVFSRPVRGGVEYQNVTFGYVEGRAALRNISLRAAPSEMIALVGPTGFGQINPGQPASRLL